MTLSLKSIPFPGAEKTVEELEKTLAALRNLKKSYREDSIVVSDELQQETSVLISLVVGEIKKNTYLECAKPYLVKTGVLEQ